MSINNIFQYKNFLPRYVHFYKNHIDSLELKNISKNLYENIIKHFLKKDD